MEQKDRVSSWVVIISTAGGLGLIPVAPGTWGTLAGVLIHVTGRMCFQSALAERVFIAISIASILLVGALVLPECCRLWKEKDPRKFVLDEVAGYLVIPLFLGRSVPFWMMITVGFLLFRLFDVVKLPGARQLDKRSDFVGVMGDDLISGVYATICLKLIFWVILRSSLF